MHIVIESSKCIPNCSYYFIFDAELYGWYGSAALPLYMKDVERIAKSKF